MPSEAEQAESDPGAFLARHPAPVIVDEVQYAPGLFRHLKASIDAARHTMGQYLRDFERFLRVCATYSCLCRIAQTLSIHAPQRQLYFYRDQQGREADFVIMAGHRAILIEAKWTELPSARDAKSLHEIAALFANAKPQPLHVDARLIVARPHNAFPVDHTAKAVHALDLQEAVTAGEA